MNRKFIASCEIFGGYEVIIDLNVCNSIDDIINIFYEHLRNYLMEGNLDILLTHLNQHKFHIHDYPWSNMLHSPDETVFYICNHC
jgi:hypothetical protein